MDLKLAGKTMVVTGGGSNIGRAIVLAFAEEGCNVIVADIDEVQAQKAAKEANGIGGKAIAVKTDVTDFESVSAMIRKALEAFGQIDVLINNVGGSNRISFRKKPVSEWDKEMKLNLVSVLNCSKAALDHMIARASGRIINISSDAGRMGLPGASIYSACKAGVVGFSKALARELGRYNINVNVISPGFIMPEKPEHVGENSMWSREETKMVLFRQEIIDSEVRETPLGYLGKPKDIANAAVFLASDAANFITGQTLSVNGGRAMI